MRAGASRRIALLLAAVLAACGRGGTSGCDGSVEVPAGPFLMGSASDDPDVYPWEAAREQPQHEVQVPAFAIDRHEVTNAEFERFRPQHARSARSACDDCPVTEVSWDDARAYCMSRNPPMRLPTEAEWEKAAKAGGSGKPASLDLEAWYDANSIRTAQPVCRKLPNALGLHDMLGNVREWTGSWYAADAYSRRDEGAPVEADGRARRVERGGAFFLPARGVTPTIRYSHPPHFRLYFLGFRCARDAIALSTENP